MDINLFDYNLPKELIAQAPSKFRDECKLMLVNKNNKTYKDDIFYNILSYFKEGDVLVRNNTKVNPVRLFGIKLDTNAKVEVLLLKNLGDDTYECLCGNAKAIKKGAKINFKDLMIGECIEVKEEGIRIIRFYYKGIFLEVLDKVGIMPLPPYIHVESKNKEDYQTVYAKVNGSSAAPTAGFHFTDELLNKIKMKGVSIVDITLNIGLGTFRPVKVNDTKDHKMHEEYYEISKESADILNKAKLEKSRIIAVGTTVVRTLESNFLKFNEFKEDKDNTSIFIEPGYKFGAVDALITNFHLPKSTLIMLISAFMGREFTLECYNHAIEQKYRFFSFGDAMFIY